LDEEQFQLADLRSLDEVIQELLRDGYIPSFCTACYRLGRTGQQFMEFAIPGFIRNFCTPNALTTLMEYLVDYASPGTRELGKQVIAREIAQWPENKRKQKLLDYLHRIEQGGERDLYF
jgi:2-iminoacetate synthase